MENKDLIILIILTILVGGGLIWQDRDYLIKTFPILIRTDKTEYQKGEILKLAIKNNLGKNICFSSCYPYHLEEKDGDWESYPYSECPKSDINEICLSARQSKFFEINLPFVDEGAHRLAIPVCFNCKDKDGFREDNKFYSNEFSIR